MRPILGGERMPSLRNKPRRHSFHAPSTKQISDDDCELPKVKLDRCASLDTRPAGPGPLQQNPAPIRTPGPVTAETYARRSRLRRWSDDERSIPVLSAELDVLPSRPPGSPVGSRAPNRRRRSFNGIVSMVTVVSSAFRNLAARMVQSRPSSPIASIGNGRCGSGVVGEEGGIETSRHSEEGSLDAEVDAEFFSRAVKPAATREATATSPKPRHFAVSPPSQLDPPPGQRGAMARITRTAPGAAVECGPTAEVSSVVSQAGSSAGSRSQSPTRAPSQATAGAITRWDLKFI